MHTFTLALTDLGHNLATTTEVTGTNISLASGSSTDDQGISEKVKVQTIIITLQLDGLIMGFNSTILPFQSRFVMCQY